MEPVSGLVLCSGLSEGTATGAWKFGLAVPGTTSIPSSIRRACSTGDSTLAGGCDKLREATAKAV